MYGSIWMKTFAVVIYISLFEFFFKMGYKKVASRNCAMPYNVQTAGTLWINGWKLCVQFTTPTTEPGHAFVPHNFHFPTERRDPVARRVWVNSVNKKIRWQKLDTAIKITNMLFQFLFDSTTCPANPYPSLSFGYTPLVKLV